MVRALLAALAVVSITLMLPFQLAHADMIPSTPVSAPEPVTNSTAKTTVVSHMTGLGMTTEEIESRLAEMTPTDLETLAANPEQMNVAGSAWAIAGFAILGAALIAILVLDSLRAKEQEQYRTY